MNSGWSTVYTGPVWRALSVQSLLDEAGFVTQVPDANTRSIDPFITGGDAFSLSVLVPERDSTAALGVVASHEHSLTATEPAAPVSELGRLTHRMRWLTTLTITAPIAFVLGLVYLVRVRRAEARPADHGFNLLTIVAAGLMTAAAIVTLVAIQKTGS